MAVKLEGKHVVQTLRENLKEKVSKLREKGVEPAILILRVGNREDDISYERGILRNCETLGIKSEVKEIPIDISLEALIDIIKDANQNKDIHGIMLFRPLPAHLDLEVISQVIDPRKDIDCMSPANLEGVFEGDANRFPPCTAKAVVEILKGYDIPLPGADIVVVGKSMVVGKPLSMLLLEEDSTVTVCHSKTKNVQDKTSRADIVVVAIGKAKFMNEKYFSENSIVIDVGINDDGDGKICGDVDYDKVFNQVKAITPVVGGVGSVTTMILLSHVVKACEMLM